MSTSPSLLPVSFDIAVARSAQNEKDLEWASQHPLASIGYTSHALNIKGPGACNLGVKLSYPIIHRLGADTINAALPVVFSAHGGGYISGSHASEEAWLLWPLYKEFSLIFISVEYRLAPEHAFPAAFEDCWYILQLVLSNDEKVFSGLQTGVDLKRVFLAGSSAGAGICAALSQTCRDNDIALAGVILNVPMLCNYYDLPTDNRATESYRRCYETMSGTSALLWVWKILQPASSAESDVRLSPLLGDCMDLAPHAIFVASEDPLYDEGIAFAAKLRLASVPVDLNIYPDVPHNFARDWELDATVKFWVDLQRVLETWLHGSFARRSFETALQDHR